MYRQIDGQTNGQNDKQTQTQKREVQTDGQTDEQMNKRTERRMDRRTYKAIYQIKWEKKMLKTNLVKIETMDIQLTSSLTSVVAKKRYFCQAAELNLPQFLRLEVAASNLFHGVNIEVFST
jgi:hypothetical protein